MSARVAIDCLWRTYPCLKEPHTRVIPFLKVYSKVYNYLDTVGRGYKPRQRGWGGSATQKDRCVLSRSKPTYPFLQLSILCLFFVSWSDFLI